MAKKRQSVASKGDKRDSRRDRKGRIKASDHHRGLFGYRLRKGATAEGEFTRRVEVDHSLD